MSDEPLHSGTEGKHPAARNSEQLAWAVWMEGADVDDCVAVIADSEAEAKEKATREYCQKNDDVVADRDIDSYHVDGPIQGGEPSVFEFEFITEHRETVVVEGPCESYAKESAEAERDHRGQYVQTVHTESRRIPKDGGSDD